MRLPEPGERRAYCIGGTYNGEYAPLHSLRHGMKIDLPVHEHGSAAKALAARGSQERRFTFETYAVYLVNWNPPTGHGLSQHWYAFHESVGVEGETTLQDVFEFLLEHYVTAKGRRE